MTAVKTKTDDVEKENEHSKVVLGKWEQHSGRNKLRLYGLANIAEGDDI